MEEAQYWAKRPKNDKRVDWRIGGSWISEYWKSQTHPHREVIIDVLKKMQFSSLLEIGCNCGPNLALIQNTFSGTKLVGVDINLDCILKGMKMLPEVDFHTADITKGFSLKRKTVDMVLLDAVLMYIAPDKIKKVFSRINRLAKHGIIIVDWFDENKDGIVKDHHWARNYTEILKELGFSTKSIKLTKKIWPSEIWAKNGYIFWGIR